MKNLFIPLALLAGTFAYAGGFRVSLQGVKQLAMAHTSAHAEDASIAFFNPAGISFIPEKFSVVAGGFGLNSKITYQNPTTRETFETQNPIGTPIYAAMTYKIHDDFSFGFSFATPFGSTVNWGENWAGNEIVQKMELKSYFFQPMASIKVLPWASVGMSYIYARGSVSWDKALNKFNGSLNIKDEKATGHGYGLGLYLRPFQPLDVSLAYRSSISMDAKNGIATFRVPNSLFSVLGVDANGQDSFRAKLPLVAEYTAGVSYRITPKLKLAADFNYTKWSEYDKLTLDFAKAPVSMGAADPTILESVKNFKDTKTFRVGAEYLITPMIAGRLGWYYDESPYEDNQFIPETPSFNMNVITAGVGFNFKSFGVDLAAAKPFQKSRVFDNPNISFSGQAKSQAIYFGLGLRYNIK